MTEKAARDCVAGARLCKIGVRPGPSGVRLRHGPECPIHPLEPIHVQEYAKGRTTVRGFRGNP